MSKLKSSMIIMICSYLLSACGYINQKKITIKQPQYLKNMRYKKIIIGNNEAWIASSTHQLKPQNWYSADSGVIVFDNSRVVTYSYVVPARQWKESIDAKIDWKGIIKNKKQFFHKCIVDLSKNKNDYCDNYVIQRAENIPRNNFNYRNHQYHNNIIWVKETPNNKTEKHRIIWYAVDIRLNKPVYSQSCLDKNYCFSWQDW